MHRRDETSLLMAVLCQRRNLSKVRGLDPGVFVFCGVGSVFPEGSSAKFSLLSLRFSLIGVWKGFGFPLCLVFDAVR